MRRYVEILRVRDLRLLIGGAALSAVGDSGTLVALIWMAYSGGGSAADVGALVVAYTAPVAVGGLVAGPVLDAFPVRRVLVADNLVRGAVVAVVPVWALAGRVPDALLFAVAVTYGLLRMLSLAGVPTLLAASVDDDLYDTANALEHTIFALGGVVGPALAGLVIASAAPEAFLALDAVTYGVFALCLAMMRVDTRAAARGAGRGLRPALRVAWRSAPVRWTTGMFFAFNVGEGMLLVLLPVYVVEVVGAGAGAYGTAVAAFTAGLLGGAVLVGAVAWRRPLAPSIAVCQALAGAALVPLLFTLSLPVLLVVLAVSGVLTAPLTIWAQTLRMRAIPAELRGRVFALLRTVMQSAPPLGAAAGGLAAAGGGTRVLAAAIVACTAVPGLVALASPAMRSHP